MEKFISFAISLILIIWYYINLLKINYNFRSTQDWKYSIISVFIFTYIFFTVLFLLIDSMTISPDKQLLTFKEEFALNFLFIFEIFILIISPLIYLLLVQSSNNDENKIDEVYNIYISKENDKYPLKNNEHVKNYNENNNEKIIIPEKHIENNFWLKSFFYISYIIILFTINIVFLKIDLHELFNFDNKKYNKIDDDYFKDDFNQIYSNTSNKVPFGLAKYAFVESTYQKIVYFNFGLLMMLGKFLGFTYMPYGMSLFAHDLIFGKEEVNKTKLNNIITNENLYDNQIKEGYEKIALLDELYENSSCNHNRIMKPYNNTTNKNLSNKDNKIYFNLQNENEYDKLIPLSESQKILKNNYTNIEIQSSQYLIKKDADKSNLYLKNKNITKNFEEDSSNYLVSEIKKEKVKNLVIITDKSYSDEISNKSNFFTNSKSNYTKTNSAYEEESKDSVSLYKSDNYDEENQNLDEEINLINKKALKKETKKIKNEPISKSSGLVSIEVNSNKSSLEVNKGNTCDNKQLNNSALNSIHNSDKTSNKNIEEYLKNENKDKKAFVKQERKKSDNLKILTIKKSKEPIVNFETLTNATYKNSVSNFFLFSKFIFNLISIVISLVLIYLIIYSKIHILYNKLFYNICGEECGFLSYRFGERFNLDFISFFLLNYSKSKYLKLDFFFITFILLFRAVTVYKAILKKGVALLWNIFYLPNSNIKNYQVFLMLNVILYTAIVLIYDFTYLIPDYLRFNGLNNICDYTNINKEYCGISFFGLLFLKISMNFHFFMYFDILASGIFITTGIIWFFRLVMRPCVNASYEYLIIKFTDINRKNNPYSDNVKKNDEYCNFINKNDLNCIKEKIFNVTERDENKLI